MKKLMLAVMATAMAVPALATDGTVIGAPQFPNEGFSNRGQCESALAQERNRQRKNPALRGEGFRELSESDFQRASRETTTCEERNGRFFVVFRPQQS